MGNEDASAETALQDTERTGLAERERQDEEKAKVNRERQLRQGVISEESESKKPESKESESKEPEKAA